MIAPHHLIFIEHRLTLVGTGVAFATPVGSRADLEEIEIIQDWGLRMSNHDKIPSVISYSLCSSRQEQQWGTDLSPHAIAMVHTKLQLDVNEPSGELDLILQELDGMRNLDIQHIIDSAGAIDYPPEGPEEIVEDYLKKIFTSVLNTIARFTEAWRMTIPVDIVVTIPAVCFRPINQVNLAKSASDGATGPRIPLSELSKALDLALRISHNSEI